MVDKLAKIETVVDSCRNFAEFIELLSEVCEMKSEHVQSVWQDDLLGIIWQRRAELLSKFNDQVEKSFD